MTRKVCLSQLASMAPESTMQASREKRRQCSPVLALRVPGADCNDYDVDAHL